jgi:hypothetical protein
MGHATLWCAACSAEVTRTQAIDGSAGHADVLAAYAPQQDAEQAAAAAEPTRRG